MSYKHTDVMAVVQAIKKLGWNFTHANETFDGDRRNLNVNFYKLEKDPEAWRDEYRNKQAAGVKFERLCCDGEWEGAEANGEPFNFTLKKEEYREVPQEVFASECQKAALEHLAKTYSADKGTAQLNPTILPHAAERALWKAQRDAGTNEAWISTRVSNGATCEIPAGIEPGWHEGHVYRVKPMKLTAKICRVGKTYPMSYSGQDWQFTGTREEYRAECEKYGYVVISEIKEVKPKKVKRYMAMLKNKVGQSYAFAHSSREEIEAHAKLWDITIIGDIEEREVEV